MHDRVVIDPKTCHGKPVIRGTRVPVVRVIGSLAGGMSPDDIQQDYDLSPEDIRAALEYAVEVLNEEQHHALPV